MSNKISSLLSSRMFAPLPTYNPLLKSLKRCNRLLSRKRIDKKHQVGVELFNEINKYLKNLKKIQMKKLDDYLSLEKEVKNTKGNINNIGEALQYKTYLHYADPDNIERRRFIDNMIELESERSKLLQNPDDYFFKKAVNYNSPEKKKMLKLCKGDYNI